MRESHVQCMRLGRYDAIVNAESQLCECFLQQFSFDLNTLLRSTILLFFTVFGR